MKHGRYLMLLLFLLPHAASQAQQLTVSSGGEGTSAAGMVSQSVGQVFYQAVQHSLGMVSAGVQQAYLIEQMYVGNVAKMGPELSLYPNPSAGDVVLKTTGSVPEDANMVPIAYGKVRGFDGRLYTNASTPNVSVIRTGDGNYEVTISGESYSFSDYTTIATPDESTVPGFVLSAAISGKLIIRTYNLAGTFENRDFSFVVYKK